MASFLRGKQTGMQNDLSAGIVPGLFAPDDKNRYGINSQIRQVLPVRPRLPGGQAARRIEGSYYNCLAYEPVQSLLAIGTNETKYGSGRIEVFGQSRVHKFLVPPRPCSFSQLQFCANRLISLDTKNELIIWDLDKGKRIAGFHVPGVVSSMVTDPMLDWCFLGNHNGEVFAYDLDRERLSPLRLPNYWNDRDSKARAIALVSMQLHPRDIGKLLIAYTHGLVVYSFKQNKPTAYFEYQVPPGAPGGNGIATDSLRKPRITHALWHPTGTFILTAHDDGSLVFFDAKDGRVVMARTLTDTKVDQPAAHAAKGNPKRPYIKIAWCCKENPEDSALLIAGGQPLDCPPTGLTFLEMGITPNYTTASWDLLAEYCKGKRQTTLETPPGTELADFITIPRVSPHFNGAQDPIAMITLLSSGELLTMSFPSGYPISPTNQLHPSVSFVHPFATKFSVATVDRGRWLGMVETRNQGELLLKGGKEAPKDRRRFEGRSIIQVAHADGTVRIWDVGHGDEIENPYQLQVDVARALNRYEDVNVTAMSMASNTGEFAVGTSKGEVVVFRWAGNGYYGKDPDQELPANPGGLTDISIRTESSLKQGLQPFRLYEMAQGSISALKFSDVGFIAVGSENGFLSIVDMRGPSVILQASMADFAKQDKRASFIRGGSKDTKTRDWPVSIEFSVMSLEGDKFSSICCFVGTHAGKVITFVILPQGQGYTAKSAGVHHLGGEKVVALCPIVADTGKPAYATSHSVAGLREGKQVNGLLVAVTETEIRVFKPTASKGASKSFDDYMCVAAAVTEVDIHGMALVGIFGDRVTRAFTLPGLKEINAVPLKMLDGSRAPDSVVSEDGSLFCWTGPSEIAILDLWGAGREIENTADILINPNLRIPPRPTISNVQWLSGTQYVSPTDLDLLIGGPDRPASKRMVDATAAEKGGAGAMSSQAYVAQAGQEGWGDYLTRQLNERTEKLNLMSDSMDSAADSSARYAEDASKWASQQKRKMMFGAITSKFL